MRSIGLRGSPGVLFVIALAVLGSAAARSQGAAVPVTLNVAGTANIYGAGYASPVFANGTQPPSASFAASAGKVLTFTSVSGTVSAAEPPGFGPVGPDGYGPPKLVDFTSHGGLSGIKDANRAFFLVGVFLSDSAPSVAPARLDFTNDENFTTLAPAVAQLFFVGDGLTGTGSGATQQFQVPATATRLFLGFVDTDFSDNAGSLSATFSLAPATAPLPPAAWGALLALPFAARPARRILAAARAR